MKQWRPLRMGEYPPPGPTRYDDPLCACGDTKAAHGNPTHGCDVGRYTPVGPRRILVYADPYREPVT